MQDEKLVKFVNKELNRIRNAHPAGPWLKIKRVLGINLSPKPEAGVK
jgi:hypothetical protein